MPQVTLHVRIEPHVDDEGDGVIFEGNKITGEVKRDNDVLFTKSVITDDAIESVCGVQEMVALEIEKWAVKNTDFMPTEDTLP
jgi:hypothetical protein